MTPERVTRALQEAHQLVQRGEVESAIQLARRIAQAAPGDERAQAILGAAYARSGNSSASVAAFKQSVELNPGPAAGWSNLGHALVRDGQLDAAVSAFDNALERDPGREDTLFHLAVVRQQLGQGNRAQSTLRKLLALNDRRADAWLLLAQIDQSEQRWDDALTHYERCLAIDPDALVALHNRSAVLKRRQRYQEAIPLAQRALRLNPRQAETHQLLGGCYAALGQASAAIDAYARAVELDPMNRVLHDRLNHLLWLEGHSAFLDSYHRSLAAMPEAHGLRRELAYKLVQANRLDEALAQTDRLVREESGNAANHQLRGGILRKRRCFEGAIRAHREAVRLDPASRDGQQELATSLMANGEARPALAILETLRAANEHHQGYIALQATALRILGHEEYHHLYDYDRLLLQAVIEPPAGFSSLHEFNRELLHHLAALHTSRAHPLDQSLVNGTQTVDDLFDDPHEVIQLLKRQLDEATGQLLDALPQEAGHPALSRKRDGFAVTGAWSVRLNRHGFHLNHYHSHGWFSGPYYVDLPEGVHDEKAREGWLKLGEPGFECVLDLPADRVIRPQPGHLVRFPSYFWHGTTPILSDHPRTVVSVDLDPA